MRPRMAAFQRRLRERYPSLAYTRVMERHESGAIHAHYGLSAFVDYRELRRLWPYGIIDVRKIRTKRGGKEDARQAARYLSKYVVKEPVRDGLGEHRYEVRQGHQPASVVLWADSLEAGQLEAVREMGGEIPAYAWTSSGDPDWDGPPAAYMAWR